MSEPQRPGGLSCAEADELAPAFVLGALEPDEVAAARAHLADCPEAHQAFAEVGGTAAYLAELPEPLEPPAALKVRLMTAVAEDLTDREPPGPVVADGGEPIAIDAERARRRPVLGWVLAAAALKSVGGDFRGRLRPRNPQEIERAKKMGIDDINRIYSADELAKGEVMFAATGVTTGDFLKGVRFFGGGAETHSVVMRSKSGTVRYVQSVHRFDKKPDYAF